MGLYRLIHVRDGVEIGRYVFQTPTSTQNDFSAISGGSPLSGITEYSEFANNVINNSNGIITDFPTKQIILYSETGPYSTGDVLSQVINNLTGADMVRVSVNNFAVNDRLYVGNWRNDRPYIKIVQISNSANLIFQYICADGTIAYNNAYVQTSEPSAVQGNFYTIPWLFCYDDETNYMLHSSQISIDTRDDGLYGGITYLRFSPTSIANARNFWLGIKDLNDIIADPDTPIGGGGFIPDLEGDDIELPGAPDETVSGVLASGFLNIYKPTDADLRAFGSALWTNAFNVKWSDIDSVSNLILNAVSNPIDFIIGLFMLPVTPSVGSSSGIYLGGINVNTINAPRVSSQYVTIDFGTLDISELYGNYLDYSNSRLSIYLPYVGTADIDVQEINGGSVHLQYIVDVFTGACVANVQCVKVTTTPWGESYQNKTVHSYSGNMAIQLPISAGSFDTLTQGLINVGLGLGTNTPAIAMQGAKDVVQGFAGDVTTRGSLSSNTGKLGYQTPYLMFTRPIESRPANLGALHGYSAGVGGLLSRFSGYVVCSDVKLDGVTATDSELNEIKSILKSGVYV